MRDEPVERLVQALRRTGYDPRTAGPDRWESRCPAHQGRRRNLSIGRGHDGQALIHCHHNNANGQGCDPQTIVQAIGLTLGDLFPQTEVRPAAGSGRSPAPTPAAAATTTTAWAPRRDSGVLAQTARKSGRDGPRGAVASVIRRLGEPTGEWTYRDENGITRLVVFRFDTAEGKEFRPVHHEGGVWKAGDPPGDLPLYRLPELAEAALVFVTEGEKAADKLATLGLAATTSSHGASSAKKTDWSPLAGKQVVLMPDNDPPGQGYAKTVLSLLAALEPPPTVKIVQLNQIWQNETRLPEGGDCVDWLTEGVPELWSDDQCRQALLSTVSMVSTENLGAVIADHGAVIRCLADIKQVPIEWLWPGRIPKRAVVTFVGDPGLGKSFLTIDIAARISRGVPWPDCPDVANPVGSVILLSAEDHMASTVLARLNAAGADLTRIFTMDVADRAGGVRTFTVADMLALEQTVRQAGEVRLVVLDPITAYMGEVDDNKNTEVRAVVKSLSDLAETLDFSAVLVTHLNKNSDGRPLSRVMGSMAYVTAPRAAWVLAKDKTNPARRTFSPMKMNLGPDDTSLAFTIDGETMTLVWEPTPLHLTAEDVLGNDPARQQRRS